MRADRSASTCPLCRGNAFGWISLPEELTDGTVGLPSPVDPDALEPVPGTRMIDRCDRCGTGIARGSEQIDLARELRAVSVHTGNGTVAIAAPNRASLQAGIGSEGWAALNGWDNRLLLTPKGLELLAENQGLKLDRVRFTLWGRSQTWMWQTLMNGLTIHANFAREVLAGRLRPANARSRLAFLADAVATVLAAPLVAVVSLPLELVAVLTRRGGELAGVGHR